MMLKNASILTSLFFSVLVTHAGWGFRASFSQLKTAHMRALQRSLPQFLSLTQTRAHSHR